MNFTINTSGDDDVIQGIWEEIPEVANKLADNSQRFGTSVLEHALLMDMLV